MMVIINLKDTLRVVGERDGYAVTQARGYTGRRGTYYDDGDKLGWDVEYTCM